MMKKKSIYILICYSIWACKPQIEMIPDPKACFSYNSSNQLTTDTLQFTNCSENSRTYLWSFGDGNYSEEATPKHNYSTPGIYTAILIAKNEISSDTISQKIEITKNIENPQAIKACFNVISPRYLNGDTIYFLLGDIIKFDNCSEKCSGYLWYFGDGSISEEVSPQHNYLLKGSYTVKLFAKNQASSDSIIRVIKIIDYSKVKACYNTLLPRFLKEDTIYYLTGDMIKFINCSENCSNYLWSFGDGSISEEVSPQHNYLLKGSYTVKLFAKNQASSDSIIRVIKIMDYSKVKACYNTTSPYNEKGDIIYYLLSNNSVTIQFNNCSENAISYLWDFGYIYGNSEEINPIKSYYTNVGSCQVTLIAKNLISSDTIVKTLNFIYPLNASFSYGAEKFKYSFKSDYNGVVESYYWDFGDGSFSTIAKPEHLYGSAGEYTVKLTVSNKYGTETSTQKIVCTLFNFPLNIDIDNDYVSELTSNSVNNVFSSKSGYTYCNILPVNGIEISSEENGYGCKLYENGATVEDSTFSSTGNLYLYYSSYWYSQTTGGGGIKYNGLLNMGPKYLAFRKKYGSIYKYGWIKMSLKRPSLTYYGIVYGYSAPKEYNVFIIEDN